MTKKIMYLLMILIVINLLFCIKVNAYTDYIDKPVSQGTGSTWGSSPDPSSGFHCFNHGSTFYTTTIKKQFNMYIDSNAKVTYKAVNWTPTSIPSVDKIYKLSYVFGKEVGITQAGQYAVWRIKGTSDSSIRSDWKTNKGLYYDACAYYNYIKAGIGVRIDKSQAKTEVIDNETYFGPIRFYFNEGNNGKYTYKPTFESLKNQEGETIYLYTKDLTKFNINNINKNMDYYVKNNTEQKLILTYKDVYDGILYLCRCKSAIQDLVRGDFTRQSKTVSITTEPAEPEIILDLYKVDKNNNRVSGTTQAKFNIYAEQYFLTENDNKIGNSIILKNEEIEFTAGQGEIVLTPKNDKDTSEMCKKMMVYVTITETVAPNGYKLLEKPINICFKRVIGDDNKWGIGDHWEADYDPFYDAEGDLFYNENLYVFENFGEWKYDYEDPTSEGRHFYKTDTGDIFYMNNANIGDNRRDYIYICNEKVSDAKIDSIEKLTLLKVDEDDQNELLSGADFTATFENVKSYEIGEQLFTGNKTYNFSANGYMVINNVIFEDINKPIKITLEEIKTPSGTSEFYYKKLKDKITITVSINKETGELIGTCDKGTCEENINFILGGTPTIVDNKISYDNGLVVYEPNEYEAAIVIPNIRLVDLSGTVWLDGDTGIRPVIGPNGAMEDSEKRVSNVYVELGGEEGFVKQFDNNTAEYLADTATRTNENGQFSFKGLRYGHRYYVTFNYDGIHYITSNGANYNGAAENANIRTNFNTQYQTINANMGLRYEYNSEARTSTLETLLEKNEAGKLYPAEINGRLEMGDVEERFNMTASTKSTIYRAHGTNLNLGIEGRGTDLALSTNVYSADVSINGQTTTYTYDNTPGFPNIKIDNTTSAEKNNEVDYNLKLYVSDYNYRIRDYISNKNFILDYNNEVISKVDANDEIDNQAPENAKTGEEAKVEVTYTLQIQNQVVPAVTVSRVEYKYDEKYTPKEIYYIGNNGKETLKPTTDYTYGNNIISITKDIAFARDESDNNYGVQTLYLVFTVNKDELKNLQTGSFNNSAEITEYKTTEGLIDRDSQPGNYMNNEEYIEDDCDKANGITIIITREERKISGYVFEDANGDGIYNNNETLIDDVIVQLIEIKNIEERNYEYIWQETTSGSVQGLAMNDQGTDTKRYDFNGETGYYEFKGFIPGDYAIRFIYGDGETGYEYDPANINKYNGQDYKSTIDTKYGAEWYNNAGYNNSETRVNTARDNEARRLQTMAWSVDVDSEKGLLLKLLDINSVDDLNAVEIKTLADIEIANVVSKTEVAEATRLTDTEKTALNAKIGKLRKEEVLAKTWMCAETSKVKVAVDSEDLTNVSVTQTVNGLETAKTFEMGNIALGLKERPRTQIRLEKEITTYILKASNGQELVTAYLDENGNLTGKTDNLQVIPGTSWKYSVSPTDLNTLIGGAHLEYAYRIKVINESEADYLGKKLTDVYNDNNNSVSNYLTALTDGVKSIKSTLRTSGYNNSIGAYLGSAYYTGVPTGEQVRTEVTKVRDYINNDVDCKAGVDFQKIEGGMDHYILQEGKQTVQKAKIKIVLESKDKVTTGKLDNSSYTYKEVIIEKDTISSTGVLDFDNYIAEVMSYTNAAGRRAFYIEKNDRGEITQVKSVTPGNAKVIDARTEIDEAMAEKVQIGEAYGDDKQTNYTWLIAIVAGIAVVAVGAFVTKKYIIK